MTFGLPSLKSLCHANVATEPFTTQAPSTKLLSQQTIPAKRPGQTIILTTSIEEPEDYNTGKRKEPEKIREEPETERTNISIEICESKDLPNQEHSLNKDM